MSSEFPLHVCSPYANRCSLLQSLNLPGSLQALEKPLGLPPTLLSHAEEIRQQEGLHRLRRTIHETAKLKANDETIYNEGKELLRSEAADDDRARLKYGTERWSRPSSKQAGEELYSQSTEIAGYLKSANSSDELVKTKLKEHEAVIQVLSGTDRDLEDYVPSSGRAQIPPEEVRQAASELRSVLSEISRIESKRKQKAESLRREAKEDDISKKTNPPTYPRRTDIKSKDSAILAETARLERDHPMQKIEPVQFEFLFEARLERYAPSRKMLLSEETSQKELEQHLRQANQAFLLARKGDSASTRAREQALQRLETAYLKYKEILSNLSTGRKFYNDLATIVNRYRDDCKQFAYQRRVEAARWEQDHLATPMAGLAIQQKTLDLQEQKQRESARSEYSAPAPSGEPLTAPTPTRVPPSAVQQPQISVWNPEIGIKFGGPPPPPAVNGGGGAGAQRSIKGGQWDATQGVKFS